MVEIAVLARKLKQLEEQEMDMKIKGGRNLDRDRWSKMNRLRHIAIVLSDLIDEVIEGRDY